MNPRPPALVVLNPSAHGGTSARRFEAVRAELASRFEISLAVVLPDSGWIGDVRAALGRGTRVFIAAGGDGTAHALLNALVDAPGRPPLDALTLGAVGLGSSNDLHKPVGARINGIPVRLDLARAAPRDVVRCRYVHDLATQRACFLVSASLGMTACANARFSADAPLARWLRATSTPLAIAWAAARTAVPWRNLAAELRIDHGAPERVALASLSVLKTEWLSGRLHFGHPVAPDSGDFDVALAAGLGRGRLIIDILALLRGRFDGRRGHRRMRAHALSILLESETALELDGEIVTARAVHFGMHPERIRLCA